jgi:hypothetical protein
MTVALEIVVELSESEFTSHDIHETVLEALNDMGMKVFYMSTKNVTNMENEINDVTEFWNVESDIIPFTGEDTSDEE